MMQLHPPGKRWTFFEVERSSLKNIGTKIFPCLGFGEDAIAKRPRAVAALLGVAYLEDQLHADRITENGQPGSSQVATIDVCRV